MPKRLASVLTASLLLVACATPTGKNAPGTAEASKPVGTTPAKTTKVEIHIIGSAALIEQSDPNDPVAVVLPDIPEENGHRAHVPYVAWLPDGQDQVMGTFTKILDPVTGGLLWHVHQLNREEVIPAANLSANPVIALPEMLCSKATSSHPAACVPQAADFIAGTHPYKPDYVRRISPSQKIVGRLELTNGTLSAVFHDICKWKITKFAAGAPVTTDYLAGEVVYTFDVPGDTLTLQLRKLSDPLNKVADLVRLKATGSAAPSIKIRLGNAVDVFPTPDPHHPADPHIRSYYDFVEGVTGLPSFERTTECVTGTDEVVFCGPVKVKGTGTSSGN